MARTGAEVRPRRTDRRRRTNNSYYEPERYGGFFVSLRTMSRTDNDISTAYMMARSDRSQHPAEVSHVESNEHQKDHNEEH